MTNNSAEWLLANYPALYEFVIEQRKRVLFSYRASLSAPARRGSGGYSDTTASKAVKLATISENSHVLALVPVFMNGLTSAERELILAVWRCGGCVNWPRVARKMNMGYLECRLAWNRLVQSFKAYAGDAKGLDGIAFAGGRLNEYQG